ncbi:MFS transporter [Rhodopila sp.]|uniref:MFS transporter n=1 Tax=Rhodopila sp. TaxID=2480087 RepID=UPI002B8CFCCA|nr:MFS transporter [Rhodopila sp.]HVZ06281.1 MFS transporter [Rhodopila sp.]
MSGAVNTAQDVPWWREPTKDQWYAYFAAWLGWTLDAFDFTIFLLIMVPISREFNVPLTAVTAVFAVTLWVRLAGATAAGWMADRWGRKAPLMISILWYSICNLAAGLSPSFIVLFLFRALLGVGMGAEWPAGAALAMESWPARSRGLMSGILQGSWGLGYALAAAAYGLLYTPLESLNAGWGWRGMLILGVLPALACVWIRAYVKEPDVWSENQKIQVDTKQEVKLPLFAIFKRQYLWNTLTGCLWMAANFIVYYSIWALPGTYLQKELGWTPAMVATPLFWGNILVLLSSAFWGGLSDKIGRRWALMIPCTIAIFIVPLYLMTHDPLMFTMFFLLQALIVGGKDTLNPAWLSERFPTEIRATAAGFVYHQGAIWGGFVAPVLTWFAINQGMGFAMPMMIATMGSLVVLVFAVYLGPETKGKELTAELQVFTREEYP